MPDVQLVATIREEFAKIKSLADRAVAQVTDDAALHHQLDPEANSIAVLMRHMAGNMRSRWTSFLTTDGEKPDRQRDREFEDAGLDRTALLAEWEAGWRVTFDALAALTDDDLGRIVHIRAEPHTVHRALVRQLAHYAGHAYQIVYLARHVAGPAWTSLSVPRGESEAFNQRALAARRPPTAPA
ncbi:MAG: DUF1572 family protein [Vicinamibacterales bacterium]